MIFTATSEPEHEPPRMRLLIETESDSVSVRQARITRAGQPIRARVPVGGRTVIAYDYEAPYESAVTYRATGVISDASGIAEVESWSEPWANGNAWVATVGAAPWGWSFTGVATIQVAHDPSSSYSLTRDDLPENLSRIEVAEMERVELSLRFANGTQVASVRCSTSGDGARSASVRGSDGLTAGVLQYAEGDTFTVAFNGTTMNVSVGSGSVTAPLSGSPTSIRFQGHNGTGLYETIRVGPVAVYELQSATVESNFAETTAATLDSEDAWIIHPTNPSLSVRINRGQRTWTDEGVNVSLGTAEETTYAASVVDFDIPGRPRRVRNRMGVRSDGSWSLVLLTPRPTDRNAVLAVTRDQTPLLLRSPASYPWDLPDGWYGIDDISVARTVQPLHHQYRTITLPLVPVDEPVVLLVPQWSWASVMSTYSSWAEVMAHNENWNELLLGTGSRPGGGG